MKYSNINKNANYHSNPATQDQMMVRARPSILISSTRTRLSVEPESELLIKNHNSLLNLLTAKLIFNPRKLLIDKEGMKRSSSVSKELNKLKQFKAVSIHAFT